MKQIWKSIVMYLRIYLKNQIVCESKYLNTNTFYFERPQKYLEKGIKYKVFDGYNVRVIWRYVVAHYSCAHTVRKIIAKL